MHGTTPGVVQLATYGNHSHTGSLKPAKRHTLPSPASATCGLEVAVGFPHLPVRMAITTHNSRQSDIPRCDHTVLMW